MCGYQIRPVPRQPTSIIAVDLAEIDARSRQLTQTAKKSSYSKQKSSLRVEFEIFLASLPSVRPTCSATEKRLSMLPIVWMLQTRMPLIAVVPGDLRLKLSIPILGNLAPSSTKPLALATGIVCWVLVILLLLFQSKVILRLYLRSNCVHISVVPKQAVPYFLLKLLRSLKLYSSARIEVLIWDMWKLQKLCVFLKTMVFCSTMFGAKLYETAPLMFLESVAIQIPSFAPSGQLEHMWLSPLNCA